MALPAIAALVGAIVTPTVIRALAIRIGLMVGATVLTYIGLAELFAGLVNQVQATFSGLGGDVLVILNLAGVLEGVSIVLSACMARLGMMGLIAGGVLRRIEWHGGGLLAQGEQQGG